MKGKFRLLMAITACCPLGLMAQGFNNVAERLAGTEDYHAKAVFEVWLPSSEEPVVYGVELISDKAEADTLSPCNYLIDWSLPTPSGLATGFSAYYDGHHYRYRGDRLQEYHMEWDAAPFIPSLTGSKGLGVHKAAQFADLLPAFLAEKIREMEIDSTFDYHFVPDTVVNGVRASVIDGVRRISGIDGLEYTYVFDYESGLPRLIELNNNPGSICEQIVSVRYENLAPSETEIDESSLIALYPEVFEKYRESNFRIENLVGTPMPDFSSPTLEGERYTHHRGEPFRTHTLVALLDPKVGDVAGYVEGIRSAVESLPYEADVIWAFVSNKAEDIQEVIGLTAREGEYVLVGARSLARDTGAASLPTLIIANRNGAVDDVVIGDNKELDSIVLQKMALMPQ